MTPDAWTVATSPQFVFGGLLFAFVLFLAAVLRARWRRREDPIDLPTYRAAESVNRGDLLVIGRDGRIRRARPRSSRPGSLPFD